MAQFHWDPASYLALMREEVPDYERLQDETAAATGTAVRRVLELGTGTGETARRVLERHPEAILVGVDASREMLEHAAAALPADRVQLRVAGLHEPLPDGPFDVIVSALTVHHLDAGAKAQLFRRAVAALAPRGRLVLGDVVVPQHAADAVTPIDGEYDLPDSAADQLAWMTDAGLRASVAWAHRDLAVLVGDAPGDGGVIDELVANNQAFAAALPAQHLDVRPRRRLVIVTCMDSRLDVFKALGLREGEAHILRNAGGVITDDVIRSLAVSQRRLGTREVMLIHHTACGLQTLTDDGFRAELQEATGVAPAFAIESFTDVDADVRQSILRVRRSPFVLHRDLVRGFVYDVDTHGLREVDVERES